MEAQTARTYRFGEFEADAYAGELRKQGRRLHLSGQPFQVLLLLLERPGQVVTREEIHQQLWPDGTFVDFDHGLNTAINKLRETLGDSASNPRFIETLPRKGYRFIAPVEAVNQGAITEVDGRPQDEEAPVQESSVLQEGNQNGANRTFLTQPDEVSQAPHGTVRILFVLAQIMYLCFYLAALARLGEAERILEGATRYSYIALIVLIVTAAIGIPVRLFLLSSIVFRAPAAQRKYLKLFPVAFVLDEVWGLAPFLLLEDIGFGLALAATAALLYLPFAQRSLILMGAADFGPKGNTNSQI
jgi:DNA-binding winged helix-turn-helix (wHTH) protein